MLLPNPSEERRDKLTYDEFLNDKVCVAADERCWFCHSGNSTISVKKTQVIQKRSIVILNKNHLMLKMGDKTNE